MRRRVLPLLVFTACFLSGCEDYQLAEKSTQVVLSKVEYEKMKTECAQLKTAVLATQAKQVGRYQLHKEGLRTWRLDTATGSNCLLLATDADWKGKGKEENSCNWEDMVAARERHKLFPSIYDENGDAIAQK